METLLRLPHQWPHVLTLVRTQGEMQAQGQCAAIHAEFRNMQNDIIQMHVDVVKVLIHTRE